MGMVQLECAILHALSETCHCSLPHMRKEKSTFTIAYFSKNFAVVLGLVMIWRGVWEILDKIDLTYFHGDYVWTAIGGIIVILYMPDHDLKEIQQL
jgi:hypothetical protein